MTYEDLVRQAEPARSAASKRSTSRAFSVCIDTSSIAVGAIETLDALRAEVARRRPGRRGRQRRRQRPLLRQPGRHSPPPGTRTAACVSPLPAGARGRRRRFRRLRPRARTRTTTAGLLGALHGSPGAHVPTWTTTAGGRSSRAASCRTWASVDPEDIDESIARGAYSGLGAPHGHDPGRGHRRSHRLHARRPRRLLLPHRPQVGLPAHLDHDPQGDGLQRRRGRPRRLGQPHDHGERPSRPDRGHDDRRLGHRRRTTATSTSARSTRWPSSA